MGFKIFGQQFGAAKQVEMCAPASECSGGNYQGDCATMFGHNNLIKPWINDWYRGRGGYVLFGTDNLYPQMLNELYYSSSLHRQICDYKVSLMAGKGWYTEYRGESGVEKMGQALINLTIKKYIEALATDLVVHNRMYLKIVFDSVSKKLKSVKRIDPVMVRHNRGNMFGDINEVHVSRDWQYTGELSTFHVFESKLKGAHTEYIYMQQNLTQGLTTYALPTYIGANNWMYLDGDVSNLHRTNINNSINPSFIFSYPRPFATPAALEAFKNGVKTSGAGSANAGKVIVLQSQSPEDMPVITTVAPSQNDKLFNQTSIQLQTNICYAHGLNPAVLGMKVNSSLGNAGELISAQSLFSDNIVLPLQIKLKAFIDGLIDIADLSGEIIFGLKQEEIIIKEEAVDKEAEARAQLKGSVGGVQSILSIQAAVAAGTTQPDAGAAILELIFGMTADEAKRMLGGTSPGVVTPGVVTPGAETIKAESEVVVNDHLKNLTGRQMQGMMRIIKKFMDGKINEATAITMLVSGFGLTTEDAKSFLDISEENITED